jgi:outer membrane protein
MNAKQRLALSILSTGALALPTFALSSDLPYIFVDPLRTMPDVVEKGVVLPGDSAPISCGTAVDLAQPLALGDAVDLALCNNQQIKAAWADIKSQAAGLGVAKAGYLPSINMTGNWTHDNISYPGSGVKSTNTDKLTYQASAMWRILDFGGRSANRRSSEYLLAAAIASHDATLQKALAGVIQAYFDAMTADAALTAKTQDEQLAERTLNSAKVREAKGAISQSDTLRATTALARASLDKNRAFGEYHKTVAVLRQVLGLPTSVTISLPRELNEQGEMKHAELNYWLEKAQESHPAIVAARKQLMAAQQQVTVTKSAGLPTLNLSGNYYQNTRPGEAVTYTNTVEKTVVLAVTIPLFDGFNSTYKLRNAQAQVEKKAALLADTEQRTAMEVIKAHADATSSLRNLDSSATLLRSAQSALVVSQRKYDKGAADITEVLSTQSALSDAWQERVRCLAEWNSARLQLLASAGQMGRFAVNGSSPEKK